MILAFSFLLAASTDRGFRNVRVYDESHRTSWDLQGRRTAKYAYPPDIEKTFREFGYEITKAISGKEPIKSLPPTYGRTLIFAIPWKFDSAPTVRLKFGAKPAISADATLLSDWTKQWFVVQSLPSFDYVDSVPTKIGIANGPWRQIGVWFPKRGSRTGANFSPRFVPALDFRGRKMQGLMRTVVDARVPASINEKGWQLVAYDKDGTEISGAGSVRPLGNVLRIKQWFEGSESNVDRVELQTRGMTWTSLGNVPLDPK